MLAKAERFAVESHLLLLAARPRITCSTKAVSCSFLALWNHESPILEAVGEEAHLQVPQGWLRQRRCGAVWLSSGDAPTTRVFEHCATSRPGSVCNCELTCTIFPRRAEALEN